ncbi:PKD domain-containing protein [Phocaeicola vulgatus]|uniref:PKD domain-containing protein n=1 Tax=Phocaeicola vulgatus TaxID=821 RepID=A0A6I0H9X6_PHOVU|nr:PKD domain-containing protein [Phocaeicola vulgatus]KAB3855720.1 PKD domain-containing protein [Phocaeicola vulgatus]KAB3868459.1 PKD domain-containing protein [Phocaeicola vulgatus]KAB3878895.1 PKD domain-containing protein [Phocaeicola vulgatus]KAB3881972.1 PKD domain-containing protein [Phocaeicola vulgatus]
MNRFYYYFIFVIGILLASCNKNEVITEEVGGQPIIELDSETGIYTVKAGHELTIVPTYRNVENALFAWTIDGTLVSSGPSFQHTWNECGDFYVKLRVDNTEGYAEEELKVEVKELTPPVISLVLPSQGLKVVRNTDYTFTPDIQHSDVEGFKIEWIREGKIVSTEKTYTFHEKAPGTYTVTINASNVDGATTREIDVEVVETMPYIVKFPTPSYRQTSTDKYTFVGRPVFLRPLLEYFDHPHFEWSVDGQVMKKETSHMFKFTPSAPGEYTVACTVSEDAQAEKVSKNIDKGQTAVTAIVKIICVNQKEQDGFRSSGKLQIWDKVYEYTPAPGQFINETSTIGGMTGNETSPEAAVTWATRRLKDKLHVSLGTFGGYIIVGFDHSIPNSGNRYDFSIQGNAFKGSSEPGIVWVMQDINGNGLPDDEWYELKGSETGKNATVQNLAVTYYRPEGKRMDVRWVSSDGRSGWVDYLSAYHTQDYYYPAWIAENSYTLTGTCLAARNTQDSQTGYWDNRAYDWGYVDNFGIDRIEGGSTVDGSGQRNGFKISNAIHADGSEANLQYIDFIKVQCGVLAKSGWLGEVSTEVFSFEDLTKQ